MYDGFLPNSAIEEAETIFLNYPLNYPLNVSTHRNNLRSYEVSKTETASTSYALQNIVRLGLGETPTAAQFEASFVPFVRSEFQLWSQYNGSALVNRNHVAGAGGFLQQIINGFAGIRLLDDGLVISNVQLPPGTTRLMLNGILVRNLVFVKPNVMFSGFRFLKGSYLLELTQTEIVLRIKTNDLNTEFAINGVVVEPTNSQCMYFSRFKNVIIIIYFFSPYSSNIHNHYPPSQGEILWNLQARR